MYFRLVKAGYGSLSDIKTMTAYEVIQALYFENFEVNYQKASIKLIKESNPS